MTEGERRRRSDRDWTIFAAGVIVLVWELVVDKGRNPTWGVLGAGMMGWRYLPDRDDGK
jgi:hypothetical protein